jgi:hypothetical protein
MFYGYVEQGQIEEEDAGKKKKAKAPPKLKEVNVFVYSGDSIIQSNKVRETGFYAALLPKGAVYHVVFEKEGFFCKSFEIDCRDIEYPHDDAAIKCMTDVTLFPKVEDSDLLNLCKVPYAKAQFDISTGNISWDMAYTDRIKQKFIALAQPYYTASSKID